ncbi:MAG: tetraacyldisaccharide 4'-kinase [Nitrospirae bacterium]|nr:MAG: tetraacyldisaccharide 4'-kinase [Nitrospirota bacterium]
MGIFEFLYYLGYSAKKYYSLRAQKRLPYRVISIGNITAGGTGKTPATIALTEEAKKRGFNPCILTRGYKGKAKGPCFVSRGEIPLLNAKDAGDEPFMMAGRLRGIPIVKGADRYEAGMFAIKELSAIGYQPSAKMLFILDDGFQHWRLFRDKDILLIDAEEPFDRRRLLPIGLLREPLKEIKRADIIVITNAGNSRQEMADSLIEELRLYNARARIFTAEHKPSRFMGHKGETMPLKWAAGKNFFAFCGIGNPGSFKKTLLSTGCELKGIKAYRDHYKYKQKDIDDILKEARKNNADWLVTTEKDMTRLKGLNMPENLIAITIRFSVDERFYDYALK